MNLWRSWSSSVSLSSAGLNRFQWISVPVSQRPGLAAWNWLWFPGSPVSIQCGMIGILNTTWPLIKNQQSDMEMEERWIVMDHWQTVWWCPTRHMPGRFLREKILINLLFAFCGALEPMLTEKQPLCEMCVMSLAAGSTTPEKVLFVGERIYKGLGKDVIVVQLRWNGRGSPNYWGSYPCPSAGGEVGAKFTETESKECQPRAGRREKCGLVV